jgi:hypothetical protein
MKSLVNKSRAGMLYLGILALLYKVELSEIFIKKINLSNVA